MDIPVADLERSNGWQVMWMDPALAEQGPEAFAAAMQEGDAPA